MYEENVIVTIPTAATNATELLETCPKFSPTAINISENSDICATVTEAKNDVLFLNLSVIIMAITIRGFPIKINAESMTICDGTNPPVPAESEAPKRIKNIIMKKSRSGLTRPEICILYGEEAIATPAKNAPIATENPACSASAESIKAHAIAATNSNSTEDETILKTCFSKYFAIKKVKATNNNPFA